jgi:solute:Na+ symporter, SSS family
METKIAAVAVYTLVLIAIGYWSSRRVTNVGDFFIAGRKVGPWVSAFAYGTTYFSAVLFIGYAGRLGWGFGINTMWIVVGNVVLGSLLAWWVLARRTRQITTRLDAITMPEFLAIRYNCDKLRPIAAAVVFIFLVPYSASVYQGLGYLFQAAFEVTLLQAQIFMAVVTGVYLLLGGYLAVTLTDFFQGLLQIFGVFAMIAILTAPFGGLVNAAALASAPGNAPALAAPGPFPGWLILTSLVVLTSLGVWGLPHMVQKFYSIKRLEDIRPAMIISSLFALVIAGAAYFTGSLSHLYFTGAELAKLGIHLPKDADMIVPTMMLHTPDWFLALILLIVLAASMSTLASLVLVSGAAISVDMLGLRVRGEGADKKGVLVLRVLCAVFVAMSVALAAADVTFIVNLMSIAWGALASFFLAPYVYGILWRRANLAGAVAAMVVGLGMVLAFVFAWGPKSPGIPFASALGMIVPLVVLPVVALLTKPTQSERVDEAFAAAAADKG